MKSVNLLKLKWLILNVNKLDPPEQASVLQVCEKCYQNLSQVPNHFWDQIDSIYSKFRSLTGAPGNKPKEGTQTF